jgi:hypothetical protein
MMNRRRVALFLLALLVISGNGIFAQDKHEQLCADATKQTSGLYRFRKAWDSFEIDLRENSPGFENCEAVSLELHWANGRNNGGNFNVTFVDASNRPIYTRQLSGFMTGNYEFPLSLSGVESKPWLGTPWMVTLPASVTIQAVPPFAPPSNIYYTVRRVARVSKLTPESDGEHRSTVERGKRRADDNEIVSIHSAVRLVGSTRIPLIQIELRTSLPFPVRDEALKLQIGKREFLNELGGDYTGRKLTLSLTAEMFAELEDGSEIVAFFDKAEHGDVWYFGRLSKETLDR